MAETKVGKGSCLCGAVKVTANAVDQGFGACHCSMCRKWTGGPLMSVMCGSDVTFEGEDAIGIYNSSGWAERGFCKQCGSGLFYRLKGNQQYHMPVGLFENLDELTFNVQVFIDKKPDYYSFSEKTNDMTEAEVFAKYGGSS
ncbi:MAG: GFA family protein [Proteobacteria bacterium]|nr:GFA family protein [Pseudomonadota bacterium]